MKKTKKKKVNYLDNKKFFDLIVEYQASENEKDRIALEYFGKIFKEIEKEQQKEIEDSKFENKLSLIKENILGGYILLLTENISKKPNFINYTYLGDMKAQAIETCWRGLRKFNPERTTNAFSYFTQTVINAFIYVLNKEKLVYTRNKEFQEIELEKIIAAEESMQFGTKKWTQEVKNDHLNY